MKKLSKAIFIVMLLAFMTAAFFGCVFAGGGSGGGGSGGPANQTVPLNRDNLIGRWDLIQYLQEGPSGTINTSVGDQLWATMYAGSFIEFRENDTFVLQFPMRNANGQWSVTDIISLIQAGITQEWNATITGNNLNMNRTSGGVTEAFVFSKAENLVSRERLLGRWELVRFQYSDMTGMFNHVVEGPAAANNFIQFNDDGTFSKRAPQGVIGFATTTNGQWQLDSSNVVLIEQGWPPKHFDARFEATILTLTHREEMMGMTMSTETFSFRISISLD